MTDETDLKEDLHAQIDQTINENDREKRVVDLESKINALENKPDAPGVDLEPINSRISNIENTLANLPQSIAAAISGIIGTTQSTGEKEAEHKTEIEATPPEPEQPKIVTQIASRTDLVERPPRVGHFLHRRIGR